MRRTGSRVFITDCEGPISKNDNAYELASLFLPQGDRFFTLISRYDDVLADIVKRQGYKAGDTLRLILPFLRAYGATNEKMKAYSAKNILLVPGADETLLFVRGLMPAFIVSTSYEHYVEALCDAVNFPKGDVYCTRADMDRYLLDEVEAKTLRAFTEEINKMPMIEIPKKAQSIEDLPLETQATVKRLDEIFWEEISRMRIGRILIEVNPVGGYEKAKAVKEIVEKVNTCLSDVIYIGDSITDVESFKLVRSGGGLTVSFNGNEYAIREAELAVLSHHTVVIAILAELFRKLGKEQVLSLAEDRNLALLEEYCNPGLFERIREFPPEKAPLIERITSDNIERLTEESSAFRATVRGEAVAKLG